MPPGCVGLVVALRTTLLGLSNLDGGTLDELLNGLTSRSLPVLRQHASAQQIGAGA
jgi:hypothetical protein